MVNMPWIRHVRNEDMYNSMFHAGVASAFIYPDIELVIREGLI